MFETRQAELNDVKSIVNIWLQGWLYAYKNILSKEFLEKKTNQEAIDKKTKKFSEAINSCKNSDSIFLVMTDKDKVIGYVEGGIPESKESNEDKELYNLYIDTEYIGKGIGKQLFKAFAEEIKKQGAKTFGLMCFTDNKSMDFYKKMGGKITITRPSSEKWESKLGSFLAFDVDEVLSK